MRGNPSNLISFFLSSLLLDTVITVSNEEFLHFFEQFGPIIDSIVMLDRVTKRSRGFGFVTFAHEVSYTIVLVLTSCEQLLLVNLSHISCITNSHSTLYQTGGCQQITHGCSR